MHLKKDNKKILLHTCCAVCSGYPITSLKEAGWDIIAYFFNPNIYPHSEYLKRLDAQKKLCDTLGCELIIEEYATDLYNEIMVGYENHPEGSERCKRCFELRLLKTIQKARELGINNYTTSLPVSPHKNFKVIKNVGNFFSGYFNIDFLSLDFKKQDGFLKSNLIAKSMNLYRQNYCGCELSMKRQTETANNKVKTRTSK